MQAKGLLLIILKTVHKSGGEPWVRIASSVQSQLDSPLLPNAPSAETARWKRCVPRLPPIIGLIAKGFYLHRLQIILSSLLSFAVVYVGFAQSPPPKTEERDQPPPSYQWNPVIPEWRPLISAPRSTVDDEPIVPEWMNKDVEGAKWIAKIMPVEKQSFSRLLSLIKVDKPS